MIDLTTGWFKVKAIKDKMATTIMDHFNNEWLCHYPQPQKIIFDNGGEFKQMFKKMCKNFGIKIKPMSSYTTHKQIQYWNAYTRFWAKCYAPNKSRIPSPSSNCEQTSLLWPCGQFTACTTQHSKPPQAN
jgi:hypothetical protein